MRSMVWFRSDLRTHDHRALSAACAAAGNDGVIGVFLLAPVQWREHDWGGVKVRFILRTLRELSVALAKLNIPLIVERADTFADAPEVLAKIAARVKCGAVFCAREYEVNEQHRDSAAEARLTRDGVVFRAVDDQCIVEPGAVRTGEDRVYTVFTPFKKAWFRVVEERGMVPPLVPVSKQARLDIEPSPIPDSLPGFDTHVPDDLWPAGEDAALARLRGFAGKPLTQYKHFRDLPAEDGTSRLSPYLAIGAISPRACLHAAIEANEGKLENAAANKAGQSTWISELAWREFYKHILVGFPRVCMGRAFKPATDRIEWVEDRGHFAAWCEGRTGVPIVDAGMRQLATTGWMHNRVRMITAMYLSKDLFLPWRWGERHFMRHLVDADFSQNNGGWQWSASTGTDAAPYFRIFNPVSQSRKFDPSGEYIRRFVPELAALEGGEDGAIHDPSELPELARAGIDYPRPIVDRARVRERVLAAFKGVA
ncbi:MAG: deoxyribodipyrimidine photo-lyase [Phycisphaeraceae bacterium]|nr:deoxyribodipyrimidine photo-lyase [Phycisphaeraceae bacterium]